MDFDSSKEYSQEWIGTTDDPNHKVPGRVSKHMTLSQTRKKIEQIQKTMRGMEAGFDYEGGATDEEAKQYASLERELEERILDAQEMEEQESFCHLLSVQRIQEQLIFMTDNQLKALEYFIKAEQMKRR